MKFKHNQRVTCEIHGEKITDARISISKDGTPYICQNEWRGDTAENRLGYRYSWMLDKDFTDYSVTNLRPVKKTFEDLEVGDEVVSKVYKDIYRVTGKKTVIELDGASDWDKEEFEKAFTIPEQPTTYTLEEARKIIAKAEGREVEDIIIK